MNKILQKRLQFCSGKDIILSVGPAERRPTEQLPKGGVWSVKFYEQRYFDSDPQQHGHFSKGQKLIGRFILENYDKAAFMTASRLGKTVSVSESTVVRFAAELGYDGYPAMQKALQEMIRSKLTTVPAH